MRQLVVASSFPFSTHTFITREVASALADGHDVYVLAPTTGDEAGEATARQLGIPGDRVIYLNFRTCPLFRPDRLRFSRAMARAAMRGVYGFELAERRKSFFCALVRHRHLQNLDLIHAHFLGWAHEIAIPLGSLLGVPVTVTAHNVELPTLAPEYLRGIQSAVDRVVLVSSSWRRIWIEKTKCAEKLEVVHNGVDLDQFPRMPQPRRSDRITLLTISRLVPEKRVADAILGVHRLHGRGIDCQLTIVGEGPERARLESLRESLRLGGRVFLSGAMDHGEVRQALQHADILLHPSEHESFGIAVAEGMAACLPVVAGRSEGVSEIVEHGVSGYLYQPGDLDAMCRALATLCEDEHCRWEMGRRARRRVAEAFSWKGHMEKMYRLWDAVIHPRHA